MAAPPCWMYRHILLFCSLLRTIRSMHRLLAFRLNMRERDLREYNDALGRDMQKGDRIFMAAKKNTGENAYVWTHTGQSLWQLSQEEGVYIEAIQKWNGLDKSIRTFRTRQKIYLKKVKDENVR